MKSFGKSVDIPPNCLVERFYRHSIQLGQVRTQHHVDVPTIKNAPFDLGDGNDQIRVLHSTRIFLRFATSVHA
jgi:hypothetical protein